MFQSLEIISNFVIGLVVTFVAFKKYNFSHMVTPLLWIVMLRSSCFVCV